MAAQGTVPSVSILILPVPSTVAFDLSEDKALKELRKSLTEKMLWHLKEASSRRNALQKITMETAPGIIESYLEYAHALNLAVPSGNELGARIYKWKSAMTPKSAAYSTFGLPVFEMTMSLVMLAIALRNQAGTSLASCSTPEGFDILSREASQMLSKAAGVFDYIVETVLPQWTVMPKGSQLPEIESNVLRTFSKMSNAEAQHLAIRKAILKNTSPGLLAKLCIDVANKYGAVCAEFQQHLSIIEPGLGKNLVEYTSMLSTVHRAMCFKFIAMEASNKTQYGRAVSYINASAALTDEIRKLKPGPGMKHLHGVCMSDLQEVVGLQSKYTNDNNSIALEPVTPVSQLEIPEGKSLAKSLPYVLPAPAFTSFDKKQKDNCLVM